MNVGDPGDNLQAPKGDGSVNVVANPLEIYVPSQTAAPLVRSPDKLQT